MVSAPVRHETRDTQVGPRLPFRLRHVLALAIFALVGNWIWPRGFAAWRLHNLAVVHADYALCMVGPTGPELLKSDPAGFIELARRRIVAEAPDGQPFLACQKFVEQMGAPHEAYRMHSAFAEDFVEYHNSPGHVGRTSLERLDLSASRLHELADMAWPFVRRGPGKLMKPSSHAKEAPHVTVPPVPAVGSGLPSGRSVYRSTVAFGDTIVASFGSGANAKILTSKNRGIDWSPGGRRLASEIQDRCVADEEGRAFTLSRMNDGRRIVVSQGPSAPPQIAALAPAEEEVAGISCDHSALVAALVLPADDSQHRPVRLRICPFRMPCRDLSVPSLGQSKLYYPVDVARVGGDTILARTSGGVTRVSSSRDDGRSWLPWTVAFDKGSTGAKFQGAPFKLLVVADEILLYAGSGEREGYPLLVSRDHGASFIAPRTKLETVPDVGSSALAQRD